MRKVSLFVIALIGSVAVSGQEFIIRAGLGYAFPQATQTLSGEQDPYNGSYNNNTDHYDIKPASYSAGIQSSIGLEYLFTDHIGVQLDAGIGVIGKEYTFNISNIAINGVDRNVSIVTKAKTLLTLCPSIVMQTGSDKKWNGYARFGMALPLHTTIMRDEIISNVPGTGAFTVYDFTFQMKHNFSLGFTGAAGVLYKVNDILHLWAEVSVLSMSLYLKESTLQGATVNGRSVNTSSISGTTTYSQIVTADTNFLNRPTYSQPFSNVSFNFGIAYTISKHKKGEARRSKIKSTEKKF